MVATPSNRSGPARRLTLTGAAIELAAKVTMQHRLGALAGNYRDCEAGRYDRAATTATVMGAAITAIAGRRRLGATMGGSLVLAGAVLVRWSVFKAGFQSAVDPAQTIAPQRTRLRPESSRETMPQ
jgi:hypothetical protein